MDQENEIITHGIFSNLLLKDITGYLSRNLKDYISYSISITLKGLEVGYDENILLFSHEEILNILVQPKFTITKFKALLKERITNENKTKQINLFEF